VRHRIIKIVLWTYMVLVVISTTYFGWHYIADDIAGVVIAFVSFYLGAIATGQKFDQHGRHSHPTTTTRDVPVDSDVDAVDRR
jgi:membrane-associated phospholipid phosphatase